MIVLWTDYPPNPSPWSDWERTRFLEVLHRSLEEVQQELGEDYLVTCMHDIVP